MCFQKNIISKTYIVQDIETYSNNFYYVDSDEEYYDEKCVDLFSEAIRKI